MSIFSKIQHAIFGDKGALGTGFGGAKPTAAPAAPHTPTTAAPTPVAPTSPAARPAPALAAAPVDVEAILTQKAAAAGRPSNWRTSIVDLMTLLGLDSSRAARTELAHELGYTGGTEDSATMNIWLHRQVMRKLAENGGKVPADLQD